jgi:curli biogenesis system outer membrane secretion channel CsgG
MVPNRFFPSLFVFLCVLVLGGGGARAQNNPTVVVRPLEGDMSQIQGWQPALGEGLAEMLTTELTKSGKFDVLESTALKDVINEVNLGEAGYVDQKQKVQKGGFAAADYMFSGKVTRFGSKKQGIDLGGFVPRSGGALGIDQTVSDVRIDWRIIDIATRRVVKAASATGTEKGVGFNVGVAVNGNGGNIGFSNSEFMNSALGKATVKALAAIMADVNTVNLPASSGRAKQVQQTETQVKEAQKVVEQQVQQQKAAATEQAKNLKGDVLAVPDPQTIIVSLGAKDGLKPGDKLRILELIETKENGQVVFSEDRLVGEVVLDVVQEARSKAKYNGQLVIKKGWKVQPN